MRKRESRNRDDRGITFWLQWGCGTGLSTMLLCFLATGSGGSVPVPYRILAVFAVLASLPIYSALRVYYRKDAYLTGLGRLLGAWLILLGTLTLTSFLTSTNELFSRKLLVVWSFIGLALQAGSFLLLHHLACRLYSKMQAEQTAAIVGTGELALELADKLVRIRHEPMVGLIGTDSEEADDKLYPLLGNLAHLRDLIATYDIRRLYIALPLTEAEQIEGLYIDLLDANVDVVWVPDLIGMTLLNHSVGELEGLPTIHLNESPLTSYPAGAFSKALIDRSIALLAILLLSPVLLAVAVAVKLSSPGPVIFKQDRHGWNGKIIKVWKFRSMRMHDDQHVKQATRHDSRITPVGRFIRRTSLDELPQLFNVLQGSMSLVGPRPHAVAHNDYYTGKIEAYMARHRIKPGITGLAQISGCRGETETIDKMAKRVELDLSYINNWSIWLDLKILIKTPFTLFSKDIY